MGLLFLNMKMLAKTLILCLACALCLNGCNSLSSVLFYPHQGYYQTPDNLDVQYEQVVLKTDDGFDLYNWLLFPKQEIETKGTILYLHGNGENISTHINSVAWLTLHGYEVFLLDYRGYGESSGTSTLESAFSDISVAHHWLSTNNHIPLFLFGQSMGGALAVTYQSLLATHETEPSVKPGIGGLVSFTGIIIESAPASWTQVAREAMSQHWLTWILVPATFLIPSKWDPEDHIENIKKPPILLMHSRKDQVVGFQHAEQLMEAANANKLDIRLYETNGNHTQGLGFEQARTVFLNFLESGLPQD